jgi:hypothetical protein
MRQELHSLRASFVFKILQVKFRHLITLIYSNNSRSWTSLYQVTEALALHFTGTNVANTDYDRLHSDTGWSEITAAWKCVLSLTGNETQSQSALFLRALKFLLSDGLTSYCSVTTNVANIKFAAECYYQNQDMPLYLFQHLVPVPRFILPSFFNLPVAHNLKILAWKMFCSYRLTRYISSRFLLISITRIQNSTCLDTSNKCVMYCLRISVPLNFA